MSWFLVKNISALWFLNTFWCIIVKRDMISTTAFSKIGGFVGIGRFCMVWFWAMFNLGWMMLYTMWWAVIRLYLTMWWSFRYDRAVARLTLNLMIWFNRMIWIYNLPSTMMVWRYRKTNICKQNFGRNLWFLRCMISMSVESGTWHYL